METLEEELLDLPDLTDEEFSYELHIFRLPEEQLLELEDQGHVKDIKDYIG